MTSPTHPSLGPQCLSCKRRRVKCDSATPSCRRCERDDIACPGYKKELKWAPPLVARNRKTKAASTNSGTVVQLSYPCPLAFPESLDDAECRLLHDSSKYFNARILPEMIPAHLPFKRSEHAAHEWTTAPQILRNLLLLLVKSAQSSACPSKSPSELCHYRARTLKDLKCSLAEALDDPYGMVLSGILVLIGIDLKDCDSGEWAWLYHFKAAERIIQLRGGFGKCFFGLPHSQGLLFRYMMINIFSMTTCNTSEISKQPTESQMDYIPILLLRESSMAENGHLCPVPLLQAIIKTNILRARSNKLPCHRGESFDTDLSFDGIMSDILDFDAMRWSEKTALSGLVRPHKAGDSPTDAATQTWKALALAYQYAAQLYLIASVRAPASVYDDMQFLDVQKRLSKRIDQVFGIASRDPDDRIETQCWKFALWPAIVSGTVYICWSCRTTEQMELELRWVKLVAENLGSCHLLSISEYLNALAERRTAALEANWTWNDIFPSRCAFVVC